jgi:hypothetical protein
MNIKTASGDFIKEEKRMSGTIGLTQAGQFIDKTLAQENPVYRKKLTKFILKFTIKCNNLRKTLQNYSDTEFVLNLMKLHYFMRLEKEFKPILTPNLYTHTQSYIHALTRIDFMPSTRTQLSLIRKAKESKVKESKREVTILQ